MRVRSLPRPVLLLAVLTLWLVALCGLAIGCAHTSKEACARIEQCIRRCQDVGTPPQNEYPYNTPQSTLSACERRCGTCSATKLVTPGSSQSTQAQGTPTYTGTQPAQAGD